MMSRATRLKALEAGYYEGRAGRQHLGEMHRSHLINAVLHSLAANDPEGITRPLTEELVRRGLQDEALAEAERRSR